MIDIDNADQILQGDDTHADILQALGLVLLDEVKRLQKRNEWLEEVVALAQEHGAIDLSDYGWPQWREEE